SSGAPVTSPPFQSYSPWITSDVSMQGYGVNPLTSTDFAFSGTHSLKGIYTGKDSGQFMDRLHTRTDELWIRFYYRTTGFTYDSVGTTHMVAADTRSGVYPSVWLMHFGPSRELGLAWAVPQMDCGTGPYDGCNLTTNLAHVPLNDGQWYCI